MISFTLQALQADGRHQKIRIRFGRADSTGIRLRLPSSGDRARPGASLRRSVDQRHEGSRTRCRRISAIRNRPRDWRRRGRGRLDWRSLVWRWPVINPRAQHGEMYTLIMSSPPLHIYIPNKGEPPSCSGLRSPVSQLSSPMCVPGLQALRPERGRLGIDRLPARLITVPAPGRRRWPHARHAPPMRRPQVRVFDSPLPAGSGGVRPSPVPRPTSAAHRRSANSRPDPQGRRHRCVSATCPDPLS